MHSKFFCCIIIRCRSQFSLLSIITLNCSSFTSDKSFFRNCFDFVSAFFVLLLFKLQTYFSGTRDIIVKNNIVDAEEFEQKNVRTFKKTFLQRSIVWFLATTFPFGENVWHNSQEFQTTLFQFWNIITKFSFSIQQRSLIIVCELIDRKVFFSAQHSQILNRVVHRRYRTRFLQKVIQTDSWY